MCGFENIVNIETRHGMISIHVKDEVVNVTVDRSPAKSFGPDVVVLGDGDVEVWPRSADSLLPTEISEGGLPVIKPLVTQDGDELCDYAEFCPQRGHCVYEENYCKLLDKWVVDETICPVAARRNAALLRECRMIFEEPNGLLGSGFLPFEWRDDIRALLERIGE
jgi:hypothetical protein